MKIIPLSVTAVDSYRMGNYYARSVIRLSWNA